MLSLGPGWELRIMKQATRGFVGVAVNVGPGLPVTCPGCGSKQARYNMHSIPERAPQADLFGSDAPPKKLPGRAGHVCCAACRKEIPVPRKRVASILNPYTA